MGLKSDKEPVPEPASGSVRRPSRLRRWTTRGGIALGILLVLGGCFLGVAEHYTAQPNFCASCHIMEPYYATWKNDIHGGKLDIACVDCHYAPGERTTINAKLRGLSQVTSYFSGRYGKTRPRAHVAPESCMTAGCHGNNAFMEKPLQVGTVIFKHSLHLKYDAKDEQPSKDRLAALRKQLEQQVGAQHVAELTTAAQVVGPAEERTEALDQLCALWDAKVDRANLAELVQLEHRPVRIAQLHSLQCIDCHSNNIASPTESKANEAKGSNGQHHFSVQKSSCFTCHFNNQAFNSGTAECMRCHTPPQKAITVHEKVGEGLKEKLKTPALAKQAVKMDHSEIVARKVDCRSCHADVVMGDSLVTRRDCERCHDQPGYLAEFKPTLTTDTVARFHEVHVPQQRAKCLDCHSQIQHQLAGNGDQQTAGAFLTTAMTNCTHCHTDQHRNVLNMLLGHGSQTVPKSDPNMMFGARTNCYGCHSEHGKIKGQDVLVATKKACITCHGDQYVETFGQWKETMEMGLKDAQAAYEKARAALAAAKSAPPDVRAKAEQLLIGAAADLDLIQRGNGVHNITFAMQLLDGVSARCSEATRTLSKK